MDHTSEEFNTDTAPHGQEAIHVALNQGLLIKAANFDVSSRRLGSPRELPSEISDKDPPHDI
jgi:hypothetical protein